MNDDHEDDRPPSRRYWSSLEDLEHEAPAATEDEFGPDVVVPEDDFSRRAFLKLMGASVALAGLGSCSRRPDEEIVPFTRMPEYGSPGKALYFATAVRFAGFAKGVLVESRDGRPIKIEGNPSHPAMLGASDAFSQAAILDLYDPDRSQVLLKKGRIDTWTTFVGELGAERRVLDGTQGRGLRVLTGAVTSPSFEAMMRDLLAKYPLARWHRHEPGRPQTAREGAKLAFGTDLDVVYRFDRAKVVISVDGDFLSCPVSGVRQARDFAATRRVSADPPAMSRLYAIESTPSLAGAAADHRLAVRSADVDGLMRALAAAAGVPGIQVPQLKEAERRFVEAAARDLVKHQGAALVVVGDAQPPAVHALAHALNFELGGFGATVVAIDPVDVAPFPDHDALGRLAAEIDGGDVRTLLVFGGNPAFTEPAEARFAEALRKVKLAVHVGFEADETASACTWHVPAAHDLESWADARAWDGTTTILQPLIAPLYGGRTDLEVLAAFLGDPAPSAHALVRDAWKKRVGESQFEQFWRKSLHDGVVAGSAAPARTPRPVAWAPGPAASRSDALEIVFRPHPRVWDGRFANNAWLQELPVPLTKLTWENAVQMSPSLAGALAIRSGDVVEVSLGGRTVAGPAWIQPGQAEKSVTLQFGYGRTVCGRMGKGAGFDAYRLWPGGPPAFHLGGEIRKTGRSVTLAETQREHSMEGRDLVREHDLGEYAALASRPESGHDHPILYRRLPAGEHAWGMAIDLGTCIGCGSCTAACQAENNIPVVGKAQVLRGREMHWIRVDRYFSGEPADPGMAFEPVPCMHCEQAPCEPVCPVGATVHGNGGLNQMVYNRCVGTRYCSNNCPYKVRRFNFYHYSNAEGPTLALARNPDVTVRARGVMEKCTYCVQRINEAQIAAHKEDRPIRDGEVRTACQQACPAQAITFGDLRDEGSAVARAKKSPLDYTLLPALNTKPRTSYAARLRNPNPELAG